MSKNRGNRPAPSQRAFTAPTAPVSHDGESPKFCLHFLRSEFDVHALNAEKQASFAKAPIPPQFQDQDKFMVFRYHGKLPMAGVRVDDIYHVLWIEPEFSRLYNHG